MGMPLELNTIIVTKGKEERAGDNLFLLEKQGYRLYPLDVPIEVRKTISSAPSGQATIQKVVWEGNRTMVTYQLISLHSPN